MFWHRVTTSHATTASHRWDFHVTLDLPGHVLHDLRYNNPSHAGLRVLPYRWYRKMHPRSYRFCKSFAVF